MSSLQSQVNKRANSANFQSATQFRNDEDHSIIYKSNPMERLKYYMRDNALNSEDAFIDLCNNAFGRSNERKIKMNLNDFRRSVKNCQIKITEQEIEGLFNQIDINGDKWIDQNDFIQATSHQKSMINNIKDVIYKFKLHTDDVLQRMKLNRDHPPLNAQKLQQAIKNLDNSLSTMKAIQIAKELLQNQQTISIEQLISIFDTVEENDKIYDASWFKDTLHKLRVRLSNGNGFKKLKEAFLSFDEQHVGNVDTANFKTVIMKNDVGLSVLDINRLVAYLPLNRGYINYYAFLDQIKDINKRKDDQNTAKDLEDFANKFANYLKQNNISILQILQKFRQISLSASITPINMASFLKSNLFTNNSLEQCIEYCRQADIDQDGIISKEDLTVFVQRYTYFEKGQQKSIKQMNSLYQVMIGSSKSTNREALSQIEQKLTNCYSLDNTVSLSGQQNNKLMTQLIDGFNKSQQKQLYPNKPFLENQFDSLLRQIRQKLNQKGLSFEDFFNLLDSDHKGFINATDFSVNIDKVIQLSVPAKDGIFAFIDKSGSGLIDLNSFKRAIGKSIVFKAQELKEDSYEWELQTLVLIRNWRQREALSVEDAFRIMDQNFDGEISKSDIKFFLLEILKYEEKDITQARINRLFKLLDQFKRGKVMILDFRRFLEEGLFYGQNQFIFGDVNKKPNENLSAKCFSNTHSSFDWKVNARQQIGLVISRHFISVKDSFDIISSNKQQLMFTDFKNWIEKQNTLQGFDLTQKLQYQLFADLDLHKKGFLSESDWINAFGHFNNMDQIINEISATLRQNFSTLQQSLDFFKKGQDYISQESFNYAIQSLFPNRFIDQDIRNIWNRISKNNKITQIEFAQIFNIQISEIYSQEPKQQQFINKNLPILERLRRYLRNSNFDINEQCQKYDIENTGFISNQEFRLILKSLGMGLSIQEIDQIQYLSTVDKNNMINWKQFTTLLKIRQVDNQILDRAAIHLKTLNDFCYNYKISPKDAFRECDIGHVGHITFKQFQQLCETLYNMGGMDTPSYNIIKDIFEFIDKRQDQVIDLTEWMDALSKFPNPNVKQNRQLNRPQTANIAKQKSYKGNNFSISGGKILQSGRSRLQFDPTKEFEGLIDNNGLSNTSVKFQSLLRQPQNIQNKYILNYENNGIWESSKYFDRVIQIIGKNRKYLNNVFNQMSQNGNKVLSEEIIKQEIDRMLRSQGVIINDDQWPQLISWARKNKTIDYKFLLSIYKDRLNNMDIQPKTIEI